MSDGEVIQYSVGCHIGCFTVNFLGILSDVRWWIMLVYCQMSHGELFQYSVGCLTANYVCMVSDVSQ
jgi:hypothetical protein